MPHHARTRFPTGGGGAHRGRRTDRDRRRDASPIRPARYRRCDRLDHGQHRPGDRLLLRLRRHRRDRRRGRATDHRRRRRWPSCCWPSPWPSSPGPNRRPEASSPTSRRASAPRAGVATALLVTVGYTVAMAGVFTMSGGMVALTLAHYTSLDVPWGPLAVVLSVGGDLADRPRGQALDGSRRRGRGGPGGGDGRGVRGGPGRPAGPPLGRPVLVVPPHRRPGRALGRLPARPLHVHRLGERSRPGRGVPRPAATVPRALYLSVAIGGVLFVFFAYATITGFDYDVSSIGRSSVPFLSVADQVPRRRRRGGLDRRDRVGARRPGGRGQLPGPDALRRRAERATPRGARPGPAGGPTPRPTRWWPWGPSASGSSACGGSPTW